MQPRPRPEAVGKHPSFVDEAFVVVIDKTDQSLPLRRRVLKVEARVACEETGFCLWEVEVVSGVSVIRMGACARISETQYRVRRRVRT